jgi:Uma2 family endonuclease
MAAATPFSRDFLVRLDETEPASEYACGEVIQKPMPTRAHSAIQFFLAAMLFPFLARTGLGRGYTEFRCIFGPPGNQRTYVPDISYVAAEHLPDGDYLFRAPDLAIEILSPDQSMGQLLSKVQFYLRYGTRLVWAIDPRRSTITVLAPGEDARLLPIGDILDGGDVLPGFEVSVEEIFAQARA